MGIAIKIGGLAVGSSSRYWTPRYYVSNTGNDALDGLSSINAWRTIAKVNATSFIAGDKIGFAKDGVWREQLTVPSSGDANNPITFGAYGSGALLPRILGSLNLSATSDWEFSASGTSAIQTVDIPADITDSEEDHGTSIDYWVHRLGNSGTTPQHSGTRFIGVDVPKDATIVSAKLSFKATADAANTTCNLTINGELNATPATFSTHANFAGRSVTSGSVPWANVGAWSAYTWYDSPDFKDVVQEIVNLAGWASGNNMAIFVRDNSSTANAFRDFYNLNYGDASVCPKLTIEYSVPGIDIYKTTSTHTLDIGNLIFNNETLCGVRRTTLALTLNQGDFYYDAATDLIKIRSVSNPGTFYNQIEAAQKKNGITISEKSYITIKNFDLRYQGGHGIQLLGVNAACDNIMIEHNNISFIGGSYLTGTERYGNGIEAWEDATNITVRYNILDNIYDAGLSPQGGGADQSFTNHYWYGNIVTNSEDGFELIDSANHTLSDIYVCHNVFYNNGGGWGHTQRPDPKGAGIVFDNILASTVANVFIENNIIHTSFNYHVWLVNINQLTGIVIDYNNYYVDGAAMFVDQLGGGNYNMAGWRTHTGWDAHSIVTDPKFVTNGSDFHLQLGSPCIDAGIIVANVGQAILGAAPDIGAYEKQ